MAATAAELVTLVTINCSLLILGRLDRLISLDLRENKLTTLPESVSLLGCLQRLDLGQNKFKELVSQRIAALNECTQSHRCC